ncbi:AzlC family ABC transporter permease [Shewanella sp.]|uniref:AzlC family ABC transporter permease n=1 Tax=Shewanella sp. TaxID=50422 RepID=UPI003A96D37C
MTDPSSNDVPRPTSNSATETVVHEMHHSARSELLRGLKTALPMTLGFIPFALVMGAQAVQKGFTVLQVPLMTGVNFAGGSEFTAISLWTSPPHLLLIVAMTFLVNSRHIIMGAAFVPFMRHLSNKQSLPLLFFMCDEAWAMGITDCQKRDSMRLSVPFYLGVAACLYSSWVIFTGIGAAVGPLIGDVEQYGFDMAFTAVFLVLLKGMWRGLGRCWPWLVSLVVAGILYQLLPGAWYVAGGTLAGIVAALIWGKR